MNDRHNKKICIIYTGGTIGMVPTADGLVPKPGHLNNELLSIRDLTSDDMPAWDLIEYDPLLDSSNMTYNEWNMIAGTIRDNYDVYDGFVVLHGTDTMAYTSSALSFMLEGLDKPVIFTGSQIPLCEVRSDGKDNLITSLIIAADGAVREVCLFFGNKLFRGNRVMKTSADGLIAYSSPNFPGLANAGIVIEYNRPLMQAPGKRIHGGSVTGSGNAEQNGLTVTMMKPFSIGVIKLFPGIHFDLFAPIVTKDLQGLVLETFGTGNIPNYDAALPPLIRKAIENGTTVVVCTQCPQGTVRLGTYETSSELARAGAISGYDMTTEATVTKLAYLFSLGLPNDEVGRMMETDLRGEMTV